MVSDFGLEGLGSIPHTAKDPLSTCGVCARKILISENPMVSHQQFTVIVISGENFHSLSERYQNCGGGDGAAIYYKEAEIGLLPL